MPALQGVSISKATEFYWEKIRNKKDKNEYFIFHLKYPLPESDLDKLVIQYREYDQNLTGELNALLKSINEAESVEELESIKVALQNLNGYFKDS